MSSLKNKVIFHKRERNDKRKIYDEFQNKFKALIIHKNYTVHHNVAHCIAEENTCFECTLLGGRGIVIDNFDKALFHRPGVTRYAVKGINNLMVDNLS